MNIEKNNELKIHLRKLSLIDFNHSIPFEQDEHKFEYRCFQIINIYYWLNEFLNSTWQE